MSKHTSFKIGGIADYFIKIQSIEELKNVIILANQEKIPFQIVGNGTNLLVQDNGIRGFVVKLKLDDYSIEKNEDFAYIKAGSGMTLARLAFIALENELSGLEEISGIPGTIGGAIYGNAGAYTMPLKANTVYNLSFRYASWEDNSNDGMTVSGRHLSSLPVCRSGDCTSHRRNVIRQWWSTGH